MNLSFVTDVVHEAATPPADLGWRDGDAWLAGGTWLFSEPQAQLTRLIDLHAYGWPAVTAVDGATELGGTCTVAALNAHAGTQAAPGWELARRCCSSFLASFKIWNAATVGGNICMSLPAGPMISMASALEATYTLEALDGSRRQVSAVEFTTGNNTNILAPGELLRTVSLPDAALAKTWAFRRMSLTHLGRSTALLIGTSDPASGEFRLTVTASTKRPHQLRFDAMPSWADLDDAIGAEIPADGYHDDVHGTPAYRRHMTRYYANGIRNELAAAA